MEVKKEVEGKFDLRNARIEVEGQTWSIYDAEVTDELEHTVKFVDGASVTMFEGKLECRIQRAVYTDPHMNVSSKAISKVEHGVKQERGLVGKIGEAEAVGGSKVTGNW